MALLDQPRAAAPRSALPSPDEIRFDWTAEEAEALFAAPFNDLLFAAQTVHRAHFDPNRVYKAQLLSIKTGGCPEDCGYCSQSAHHNSGLAASKLMDVDAVLDAAKRAKAGGAERFCMGAAWRSPKDRDMDALCQMVADVKALGLETCMTLGMLEQTQADRLADAGLDYYNHNLDSSPDYYDRVVTTRSYNDRLNTLKRVREAGMHVCCGGIVGMGESRADRAGLLVQLACSEPHPESVPINALTPIEGTPLGDSLPIDAIEFARTIAVARLMMPKSVVRLSAGRDEMSDELQALCFFAGANSIFVGDTLLTAGNPETSSDYDLLARLGMS